MKPISDVAAALGLDEADVLPYGRDKAKIALAALERPARSTRPRLVLVSAITPTPAGEGKTTTTIGLGDALTRRGERVCLALREPSLGPVFGVKGGGTGGGRAHLVPADAINLHFTGDFHAIAAAHNLLAAVLDNHLHFGTSLGLDGRRMAWRRVMDMNDRALRNVVVGLGGPPHGVPRQTGFDITAASELMAILCLAEGVEDLRARLDRILVGFDGQGQPVRAEAVGCVGAMMALLRDALLPNLVQTAEGTPALVHGGPFANIAHGCNSVLATRLALHQADWAITEAGFGFDLGAEKFFDIKCRATGLDPHVVVLVASVRALAMHGNGSVAAGLANLDKHVESIQLIKGEPVIALNRFASDSDVDVAVVRAHCQQRGLRFAESTHFVDGGAGALALAEAVEDAAAGPVRPFRPVYDLDDPTVEKVRKVATAVYGAASVTFTRAAERQLRELEALGFAELPVCIAKTQSSLSDDPQLRGRPTDFEITVQSLQADAGAGFVVVSTGDILRMPGLPRSPRAAAIDLQAGEIVGAL